MHLKCLHLKTIKPKFMSNVVYLSNKQDSKDIYLKMYLIL